MVSKADFLDGVVRALDSRGKGKLDMIEIRHLLTKIKPDLKQVLLWIPDLDGPILRSPPFHVTRTVQNSPPNPCCFLTRHPLRANQCYVRFYVI